MSQPQTVACPACGNVNPSDVPNCLRCGAVLNPGAVVAAPIVPLPYLPAGPGVVAVPNYAYPPKSRGTALILEILPFFFGFLGIGWLYAGNTTAGVLWLLSFLAWNLFAVVADVLTVGFFACIHIPANFALGLVSAVSLSNYTRAHPELFGA